MNEHSPGMTYSPLCRIERITAAWPEFAAAGLEGLLRGMLAHAAGVLEAPRIILTWEEEEEPGRRLASWSAGDFQCRREPLWEACAPLAAEPLAGTSFFCLDASAPRPSVVTAASAGAVAMPRCALDEQFRKRYSITSVLSVPLPGETLKGSLLALDKSPLGPDDLLVGGIVAGKVASRLDRFYLTDRERRAAASEERLRLARDLHDGVLQSLTVAALQIEAALLRMEKDPQAARERFQEIREFLVSAQGDLRAQIRALKLPAPAAAAEEAPAPLEERLAELAGRIGKDWGLAVEVNAGSFEPPVSPRLARQIYLIVQEALINAAKHAGASAVRIDLGGGGGQAHIAVADDGRGFPFRGSYDGAALEKLDLGPAALRERVASLEGKLTIRSAPTGATLEIILPCREEGE